MAGISILAGFSYKGKQYDFTRQGFKTLSEMASYSENYLPPLYLTFCEETEMAYMYNKNNTVDPETGKWREFNGSGQSSDLSNYFNKTETRELLDGKVDKDGSKVLTDVNFSQTDKEKLDGLENYNDAELRAAIGTNYTSIQTLNGKVGSDTLQTEAQTLSGAINELKGAVDDTTLEERVAANERAITVLNGDDETNGSVDKKVKGGVTEAKTYTDEQIDLLRTTTAIQCDSKPTYNPVTNKITYVKNGTSTTIDADMIWFYYIQSGKLMQSILINGSWLTIVSAGDVNFSEYVNKNNDVVSTFTGDEVDTSKIPDLAAMKALMLIIQNLLDAKMDADNVEDSLTSTSTTKALSANQGKILGSKFADKLNKVFTSDDPEAVANKILKTNSLGEVELGDYDESIDPSSSNAVKNSAIAEALAGKVDKDQGAEAANKVLGTDENGQVTLLNPSAMGNSAENVSYDNEGFPTYTNVKIALDSILSKLYYVEPKITSFNMTPSATEYEMGQTITGGVTFTWAVNKDITQQSLTDCTIDVDDRTASYTSNISANKTFTLTIGDGEKTATASKTISFKNKIYWGSAASQSGYDSAFILGLSNSKLASNNKGTYNFNVETNEYGYIATPSGMKPSSAWVNGFNTDLEDLGSVIFTNASGYTTTYSVVRFKQKSLGSFTAEIK